MSAYLSYNITVYIQSVNGPYTLPEGANFAFPSNTAIVYYLAIVGGCVCLVIASVQLNSAVRRLIQVDIVRFSPLRLGQIPLFFLYSADFAGLFCLVYLARYGAFFPPAAVRNSLTWQLGIGGLAFGAVAVVFLIPLTVGVVMINNLFFLRRARGYYDKGKILFILSCVLTAASLAAMIPAFFLAVG